MSKSRNKRVLVVSRHGSLDSESGPFSGWPLPCSPVQVCIKVDVGPSECPSSLTSSQNFISSKETLTSTTQVATGMGETSTSDPRKYASRARGD